MRQSGEILTSVSAGHIILTPTQPVRCGRPRSRDRANELLTKIRVLYRLSYRERRPPPPKKTTKNKTKQKKEKCIGKKLNPYTHTKWMENNRRTWQALASPREGSPPPPPPPPPFPPPIHAICTKTFFSNSSPNILKRAISSFRQGSPVDVEENI